MNSSGPVTGPIGSALTVSVDDVTPVASPDTASLTAGGATVASGNLLANDTDANGLPLTVATVNGIAACAGGTAIVGAYGTAVVQSNGAYAYTLAGSQANVQALVGGQVATDSFTYTTSDGLTHTQAVTGFAQNLVTQSEAFDTAPWRRFSPGALPVVTANVDTGPFGGAATADQVALTLQNSGLYHLTGEPGPYSFGVWVKLVSGNGAFSFNYLDSTAGVNYTQAATATTGWQHVTFSFTRDGSPNSALALQLGVGQAGGTFEFWRAQLNQGTSLNSYAPTSGTAVTIATTIISPATIGSALSVSVGGTDAGKAGPALDLQSSTAGVVADLATGQWSNVTTVMPLGDSITYGWGAQDAQNQTFTSEVYRGPLWSQFLAANAKINFVGDESNSPPTLLAPLNAGYPGERTDQIAGRLPGQLATQHPNDILLMAGSNDLKEGVTPASVAANIGGMLSTIAGASPSTQIYVATLTPVIATVTSAANVAAANTDIKAAVQAAAAGGIKVTLVDDSNVILADIPADGVHPAPSGYAKLAQDRYAAITAQQRLADGTPGGAPTAISSSVVNLVGGSGNDLLIGDTRANIITAGAGNDILIGGGGNDVLTGGAGADIFAFTAVPGQVTVNDFNPAQGDHLDWDNIPGLTSVANLTGHVTQSGGATIIDLPSFVPGLGVKLLNYTGDLRHSIIGPPSG